MPTQTIELTFPTPHVNQQRILSSTARYKVAACGRRFGKTTIGQREIVLAGLAGKKCWWLAPTFTMATEVWRGLKYILHPLHMCEIREVERTIILPTGGQIEVRSTHDYHNLRGVGLDFAVLDENAFMHADVWPQIVRPMLLDRKGGALFLSTPFGRNHFWELYNIGIDELAPEWDGFHFTSYDNPRIDPEELERIQAQTPDRIWREEYLAEFTDDAGAVFRNVRNCATAIELSEGVEGKRYVIGVDLAKQNDFSVFTVIDPEAKQVVTIDRMNQVDYVLQLARLQALCVRFPAQTVVIEDNIGEMFIEQARRAGLPVKAFHTSASSKPVLIDNLSIAFERGDIEIIPNTTLVNELLSFQMERLPGGSFRYSAPTNQHDDCVMSLALAWHGVASSVLSMPIALNW